MRQDMELFEEQGENLGVEDTAMKVLEGMNRAFVKIIDGYGLLDARRTAVDEGLTLFSGSLDRVLGVLNSENVEEALKGVSAEEAYVAGVMMGEKRAYESSIGALADGYEGDLRRIQDLLKGRSGGEEEY